MGAANQPKKVNNDLVQDQNLVNLCREVMEYLTPFFRQNFENSEDDRKDLNSSADLNKTTTNISTSRLSSNRKNKCRLSLHVAAQLLFGLQVILGKKVILVQKDLEALLREVQIHLNVRTSEQRKPGQKRRKSELKALRKSDRHCIEQEVNEKLLCSDDIDFLDLNNINLDINDTLLKDMMDFQIEKIEFLDYKNAPSAANRVNL